MTTKLSKRSFPLLILLCLTSGLWAQRNVNLGDFNEVNVNGNIKLFLREGAQATASIETENIPEEEISVKVSNGKLKLSVLSSLFYKDERIQITVTYQSLRAVRASAGATVYGEDPIEGPSLLVRATAGARVSLIARVDQLDAGAGEGGFLALAGQAADQEVDVSTGGEYDGLDLESQRTTVKAHTGGEAKVVARQYLEANASMGGQIYYRGEPENTNTKIILSGTIEKLEGKKEN